MKKSALIGVVLTFFLLSIVGLAQANTVTIVFDDVYASGISVGALQMNFYSSGDLPFLTDDSDPFADKDFTASPGSSINWHSSMVANWYLEPLEDYNSLTGISRANGMAIYSGSSNSAYALRDGVVAVMSSSADFMVDLVSLQIFDFVNTADPISGLTVSSLVAGGDQTIHVSASAVPVPGAVWLLGSGLLGLVGLRRKSRN